MTPLLVLLLAVASPADRIDALLKKAEEFQSQQQRRADLAVPLLEQAFKLASASGDIQRQTRSLSDLGRAYNSTHLPERAIDAFQRALALARASGDRSAEANALSGLGSLRIERGDYAEAKALYR